MVEFRLGLRVCANHYRPILKMLAVLRSCPFGASVLYVQPILQATPAVLQSTYSSEYAWTMHSPPQTGFPRQCT